MKHLREKTDKADEKYYIASQWQLMWRSFVRHKPAMVAGALLVLFYITSLFCEFFAPYDIYKRHMAAIYAPPQRIRFIDADGSFHLRPFVYAREQREDPVTWRKEYVVDASRRYPLRLFIRGDEYKLFGLFRSDLHLFGVEGETIFLFGTDNLGRDMFSRTVYAARVSLTIGLIGVAVSFVLGCVFGGISGYFGGAADSLIQRTIEFLISIPVIPLWLALSAALPPHWDPIKVYFAITIILSLVGWCGLARVVRGKLLELREEDFVMAARVSNARGWQIISRHLLPSFISYLIVTITLAIPSMILGETSLSFLGLGLRPPMVSWGVLLQQAQNVRTVILHPWLLIPGAFVIIVVLAFNFLGDGLRDAADPYK